MDPADAVRAFPAPRAARFIATHRGIFELTDEDLREPPELLREIWQREHLSERRLKLPSTGETLLLARSGER